MPRIRKNTHRNAVDGESREFSSRANYRLRLSGCRQSGQQTLLDFVFDPFGDQLVANVVFCDRSGDDEPHPIKYPRQIDRAVLQAVFDNVSTRRESFLFAPADETFPVTYRSWNGKTIPSIGGKWTAPIPCGRVDLCLTPTRNGSHAVLRIRVNGTCPANSIDFTIPSSLSENDIALAGRLP